jgi:hypothetical protein
MIGLLARICLSTSLMPSSPSPFASFLLAPVLGFAGSSTEAKYLRMNFAETVFPAPLPVSSSSLRGDKLTFRR